MALGDVDYVEDLQVWCGMRFRFVLQEENDVVRSPIASSPQNTLYETGIQLAAHNSFWQSCGAVLRGIADAVVLSICFICFPKALGWSKRSENQSSLRSSSPNGCSACQQQHGAWEERRKEGSPEPQPSGSCSSDAEFPSLKSSCLAFLSPYVNLICAASAGDLQLPSHIKAVLLGLARRRGDLTDSAVLALVDKSFAALDLSSCSHIKPSTLVSALDRTRMLQKLNVSGCKLTNCFVYSLPSSVPHLLVLRLCGAHVSGVDSLAWSQLIPSARVTRTPDSWEEDMDSGQRRGLCELRWMAWGDVSAAVRQLYLRRWPKLNLNVHLACSSCQAKRFQAKVPRDAMPDVALDWEEFRTVPASAWRVPAHTHRPCKQRRSAAKGGVLIDDLGDDDEGCQGDFETSQPPSDLCSALASVVDAASQSGRSWNSRSQAVLQRWLDADCL